MDIRIQDRPVVSLTREDLQDVVGACVERIDDAMFEEIADQLSDALTECYWVTLRAVAEDLHLTSPTRIR